MLRIKLFGSAQAHYLDQSLPGFPHRQAYQLLCYLILNRRSSYPRERLAAVFWHQYPTNTSRKYLRNAIWKLRHTLQSVGAPAQEYIATPNDSVSFIFSSPYWLDVETFDKLVNRYQGLNGKMLTQQQATELEEAIDLYDGDLLESLYEDWCLYERERLHLLFLNALGKLMVFHEMNGTYESGLACGERILAHDNTREKIHRRLMRLYWLLGDRDAAMAQYKRCVQILRETLDVSPLKRTTQLYGLIAHDQPIPVSESRDRDDCLTVSPDNSQQALAHHLLQKTNRLHSRLEETRLELNQLESLIKKALLKAPPQSRPQAEKTLKDSLEDD